MCQHVKILYIFGYLRGTGGGDFYDQTVRILLSSYPLTHIYIYMYIRKEHIWGILGGGGGAYVELFIYRSQCRQNALLTIGGLTHNVFITLLESCAELFWDKRCSNLVATFDQIYFVWQ